MWSTGALGVDIEPGNQVVTAGSQTTFSCTSSPWNQAWYFYRVRMSSTVSPCLIYSYRPHRLNASSCRNLFRYVLIRDAHILICWQVQTNLSARLVSAHSLTSISSLNVLILMILATNTSLHPLWRNCSGLFTYVTSLILSKKLIFTTGTPWLDAKTASVSRFPVRWRQTLGPTSAEICWHRRQRARQFWASSVRKCYLVNRRYGTVCYITNLM